MPLLSDLSETGVQAFISLSFCGPNTRFAKAWIESPVVSKMASDVESGSFLGSFSPHWGQLIFTHDRKPPVLISKNLVRLGRKEGEKQPSNGHTLFTKAIMIFVELAESAKLLKLSVVFSSDSTTQCCRFLTQTKNNIKQEQETSSQKP